MDILGLIVELLLFALGIYLYLFARGKIKFGDEAQRQKSETFRQQNAIWMRLGGLALAAIMLVNIIAHLGELFAG